MGNLRELKHESQIKCYFACVNKLKQKKNSQKEHKIIFWNIHVEFCPIIGQAFHIFVAISHENETKIKTINSVFVCHVYLQF